MAPPSINISSGLVPIAPQAPGSGSQINLSAGLIPDQGQDRVAYSTGTPQNGIDLTHALNTAEDIAYPTAGAWVGGTVGTMLAPGAGTAVGAALGSVGGTEAERIARYLSGRGELNSQGVQHFMQDVMSALSGPVQEASPILKGEGVMIPNVGGAATQAAQRASGKTADRLLARALNPGTRVNKEAAAQVAPQLARRMPVQWSIEGVKNYAAGKLSDAYQNLVNAENALPAGLKVDLTGVQKDLQHYIDEFTVDADPNAAPEIVTHDSGLVDEQGKPILTSTTIPAPTTVEDAGAFSNGARGRAASIQDQLAKIDPNAKNVIAQRRILDRGLKSVYNGADPNVSGTVQAQSRAANILRDRLAQLSPGLAKANQEFSFWSKVNKIAQTTATRRVGQSGGLLHLAGAGVAGGMIARGDIPQAIATFAAIKGAQWLIQSVPSLMTQAKVLNGLADFVGRGDVQGAAKFLAARVGPAAAASFVRGANTAKHVSTTQWNLPSGAPVGVGDIVTHRGHTGKVVGRHPKTGRAVIQWNQ